MSTPITGLKNWFFDGVRVRCPGVVACWVTEGAAPALLASPCGICCGTCAATPPAKQESAKNRVQPIAGMLVDLHACGLDELRPLRDVFLQELAELVDRHAHRHRALLRPRFLHVGRIDDLADLAVQLVEDRARRSGRRHEAEPDRRFVTWYTRFGD